MNYNLLWHKIWGEELKESKTNFFFDGGILANTMNEDGFPSTKWINWCWMKPGWKDDGLLGTEADYFPSRCMEGIDFSKPNNSCLVFFFFQGKQ